jgi:molybdopterin converting factor small subunit
MKARVLFFSVLQDIAGKGDHLIELPGGEGRVGDLLAAVFEKWPALREWDPSLLIAVNHAYARRDDPLPDGAEVAIMPPVQGG